MPVQPTKLPRAVLFDMDGTLTRPLLDFPKIKAELGIGSGMILEAIAAMDDSRRAVAEKILQRHEQLAAEQSTLNPGCEETLHWLAKNKISVALITRNSRQCADLVLNRHRLAIQVIITREDGPFKPSPDGLKTACDRIGVKPAEVWMVGDGQYDIEAAAAANIASIWLSHGRTRDFPAQPWKIVADLFGLLDLLKSFAG